ncbi:DeoR/GlpR family DNA-binding transcription regulator [Phyllobacterium myrsinacearum]|uniref:DeoR/GlpR family transcriptional regulator of sugar metabolism n=1 Tax=Phyllobacterium myrsinacearum TaxID=28101 RepID=A0A839EL91_9HYPH|nr:DeoR/GlpR family DNA-binding transcription regulator [Phyllobacterium myrsinacearum]MBA8879632.1 DeoR/GlpR family transcriptional regulator of sugar metabolism [Phyllobacterium myrsinacearum]
MSESNSQVSRTLAPRRHGEILRRIASDGSASIADLAAFFDVSRETIRRDLKYLADKGQLELIHGGAVRFDTLEPGLSERSRENAEGKDAIGEIAAGLVGEGMVVFLDSGTTTLAVAHALAASRLNLTICTSSLAIALFLCHQPNIRTHILGGEVDRQDEATVGMDVLHAVDRFQIDVAFLGGGGISPDGDVTDFTTSGSLLRSQMISKVQTAYFVLDSSKFGRLTPMKIANSRNAAGVITDKKPKGELLDVFADKGMRLLFEKP